MEARIAGWRDAHPGAPPPPGANVPIPDAPIPGADCDADGFCEMQLLLPSIPISDTIVPMLHMKLGLGLALLDAVLDFASVHLEVQSAAVLAALEAMQGQVEKVKTLEAELAAYDAAQPRPMDYAVKRKDMGKKMAEEKKIRTATKNAWNRERSRQVNKPVEAALEEILEQHNIVRQQYHGKALIGNHVNSLLDNCEVILEAFTAVMLDRSLRRADTADNIDEMIDDVMLNSLDLWQVLEVCNRYMNQLEPLTDEERANFRSFCGYFGELWRESFPETQRPPKLHLLETHAPDQMDKFGSLGKFSEDPIERHHHLLNKYHRQFSAIRNFEKKAEAIRRLFMKSNNPKVKACIATVAAGTARAKGAQTVASQAEKADLASTTKR
jgi:hypothetical protein